MQENHQFHQIHEYLVKIEQAIGASTSLNPREIAADIMETRRIRDAMFPERYFSNPFWDIMLELYLADDAGETYCTSSIGLTSGIPPTTVLRYLSKLESDGFITRTDDRHDARRTLVRLTAQGAETMANVFQGVKALRETRTRRIEPNIFL